ncbi:MAG: lipoyl(octanoyl) transferase LipB [Cytophagales bacterium]|nr:MAG: lipoyl(octanoyl) transferase LipB [Cytophagales bacterium]TAF61874.1 MAG: lipoyl(octanoyl) transferase LipB [Cytophagales bacterium]
MPHLTVEDWGLIPYKEAWDRQELYFSELLNQKLSNRRAGIVEPLNSYLFFCEHPHVITMGKTGSLDHLVNGESVLAQKNIDFFKINRGGDVTYHGPGQVVGYLVFDISSLYEDLHRFIRDIEGCVIRTLATYGLKGERYSGYTGVWLDSALPQARKMCAIGIRTSQWISMHGFALNVNTDLDYFQNIVPCGIKDKAVTSLAKELKRNLPLQEVKNTLRQEFEKFYAENLIKSPL